MKRIAALTLVAALCAAFAARADEGMWTYDNFPKDKVGKAYSFTPDAKWLEEARLSSVRLAGGCSGSFVSPDGLVMTNHHCAHTCIQQLSTKEKDFVKDGFFAVTQPQEVKCPEIELNQLVSITDVTGRVAAVTKGLQGKAYNDKQKATLTAIEKDCSQGDEKVRCEVVTLYHGGILSLYKYKRFQDVRLVFAPEFATAFFGGDPDNFMFPRYDLDVSLLRAYENDKPFHTDHYFKWSQEGAKEGELTFVSGHPGGTDRDLTVSQLQTQRDHALPETLVALAEYRGQLTQWMKRSPENARIGEAELFGVENSFKAIKGRYEALVTPSLWNGKVEAEKKLRAQVKDNAQQQKLYGSAWDDLAKAEAKFMPRRKEFRFIEGSAGFSSRLFGIARMLVRGTTELEKPNDQRLREYTDSAMPAVKQRLFSKAPIFPEYEIFKLTYGLTKLREELGTDHPFVKKVLGKKSPEELATELVNGSQLKDVELREKLFKGGKAAVLASNDPFIQLVKATDADARAMRKWHDDEIEGAEKKASEAVAKAKFAIQGTSTYPDATFSLRLSYGSVKGYEEKGHHVAPFTNFAGAFERATGKEPFALPPSWIAANDQKRLNGSTPLNFVTDNDIIGGNSGSPMFNKNLEVVGLIFDGNIQSLGGEYGFDDSVNRSVAVHSSALLEALKQIYRADRVVDEIRSHRGSQPAGGK